MATGPQGAAVISPSSWTELLDLLREIRDALRDRGAPRGLGPCDLLTIEQAARVLKMGDADAETFLERRKLIRRYGDRRRVVAGELVAAHDAALREGRRTARAEAPGVPSWDELRRS